MGVGDGVCMLVCGMGWDGLSVSQSQSNAWELGGIQASNSTRLGQITR